jgi:uncharacterized protein YjbI with pentapeptide repeats
MLAIVGFWLAAAQENIQQQAEEQRAQDEALQAYLEGLGNLLLYEELLSSQLGDDVRTLARARTLTILGQVDGARKRSVVLFLYESQLILWYEPELIQKDLPIVVLSGSDLSEANLSEAQLSNASLRLTDLRRADLSGADLWNADLWSADLSGADLSEANLSEAFLDSADLSGVTGVSTEDLEAATSNLRGTTMPDGSVHD